MKKTKLYLLPIIRVIIVTIGLVACGNDDPISSTYPDSNNKEDTPIKENIENIIASNVSVISLYSDYAWSISITTSLGSVYTNKDIKYGVVCGYDGNKQFYWYADGAGEFYLTTAELYMTSDNTPFIPQGMYYISYIGLLKQQANGSSVDLEQLSILRELLSEKEREAKLRYNCYVFVEIDGKEYNVKQIN